MARRAGKAANRKARQRTAQRQAQRPATPAQASDAPTHAAPVATDSPAPSRPSPTPTFDVGSTLTTRERAEYHYVERDLRNIGLLTALMAVLLLVAYIAANALNLV